MTSADREFGGRPGPRRRALGQDPSAQNPVEETERRIMPSPARGTMMALGLIAASAVVVAVATATGWLSSGHLAASWPRTAAADPVVLLARITAAVGVTCVLATLGGRLAQRVGQPPVAGEVVAGLILGPSVVATLLPGLYHYLLPAQVMTFVSIGAQAGLAIFMFTVGAEFDPGILRGQRGVIGSASLAMMALPFALGVVTASRCSRPSTGRQGRPCRSPCSSGRP